MIDVRVYGTREMATAARAFGEAGYALFIEALFEAAAVVKDGVVSRYLTVNKRPDNRGASGIIHRADATGAVVIQTIRRSEDPSLRRPNYGPRMIRKAFLPSMADHAPYVVAEAEKALAEARRLFWNSAGVTETPWGLRSAGGRFVAR